MDGNVKWHRFDGEGYIICGEQTYYFLSKDVILEKNDLVSFDIARIIDKDIAYNVIKK